MSYSHLHVHTLMYMCEEHAHLVLVCDVNGELFCSLFLSLSLPPYTRPSHTVQLKDVQGHLYNLINVAVRFSEPHDEPIPDAKLRMELANVVRNTASLRNGRVPATIEVGNIKAQGKGKWKYKYMYMFTE